MNYVFIGPSGSGKSYIISSLVNKPVNVLYSYDNEKQMYLDQKKR
jgi:predicted ATPase